MAPSSQVLNYRLTAPGPKARLARRAGHGNKRRDAAIGWGIALAVSISCWVGGAELLMRLG